MTGFYCLCILQLYKKKCEMKRKTNIKGVLEKSKKRADKNEEPEN